MIRRPPRSTLFLHDALPIYRFHQVPSLQERVEKESRSDPELAAPAGARKRSEEHTSELQSQFHLVCRLLLEKKKKKNDTNKLKTKTYIRNTTKEYQQIYSIM